MAAENRVSVNDGKYTVVLGEGKLTALRHGEPWQDLTGNNLVYWLAVELQAARAAIDAQAPQAAPNDGIRPCCGEWETCRARCAPLAEHWRNAARATPPQQTAPVAKGLHWEQMEERIHEEIMAPPEQAAPVALTDAKDAARYRWLRAAWIEDVDAGLDVAWSPIMHSCSEAEMDADIDRAIAVAALAAGAAAQGGEHVK